MRYENVAIPAGFARSSPFTKWQGSLAEVQALTWPPTSPPGPGRAAGRPRQDAGPVLGWTIPQPDIFYGAPTLAARLGAGR